MKPLSKSLSILLVLGLILSWLAIFPKNSPALAALQGFTPAFGGDGEMFWPKEGLVSKYPTAVLTDTYDYGVYIIGDIVTDPEEPGMPDSDIAIWKYTSAGVLDSSFGTNGVFTYSGASSVSSIDAVEDRFHNILILGSVSDDIIVLRVTTSGTLDNTYGTNGVVTLHTVGASNIPTRIFFEGMLAYVGGKQKVGLGNYSLALWSLNLDGSIRTNFATSGLYTHSTVNYNEEVIDIGNTGDEGVVFCAMKEPDSGMTPGKMLIGKVDYLGVVDTTFATNGFYESDTYNCADMKFTQDDSRFFVIGNVLDSMSWSVTSSALLKFTSRGVLDNTFQTGGILELPNFDGSAMEFNGTDYIMMTGATVPTGEEVPVFQFREYNLDGTGYDGFGTNGILSYSTTEYDRPRPVNMALTSRGEVYAVGTDSLTAEMTDSGSTWAVGLLYQITTLPSLDVTEPQGRSVRNDSNYATYGQMNILVSTDSDSYPIADVLTNLLGDLNWTSVEGNVDWTNYKSYIINLNWMDGVATGHGIYVPRESTDTGVIICPDATTLDEVTVTCTNGILYEPGNPSLSIATIGGRSYWHVAQQVSTGGISIHMESDSELPDTGAFILPFVLGGLGLTGSTIVNKKKSL